MTIAGVRQRRLMTASDTKSDAENAFAKITAMPTALPYFLAFGQFLVAVESTERTMPLISIFAIVMTISK
jgi:hypothetical protein